MNIPKTLKSTKNTKKTSVSAPHRAPYTVPFSLQISSVALIIGVFVMQSIYMLHIIYNQYQDNPNVGGSYSFLISTVALPVLLFAAAYWLNPRKLAAVARSFESLLLAMVALSVWGFWNYFGPQLFSGLDLSSENYVEQYARYEIVATSIYFLLYTAVLVWLRRSKRWQ